MTPPRAVSFTRVTQADLPVLHAWLRQPHVREWWGDPEEEIELIRSALTGADGVEPFLIRVDSEPVGYIQSWDTAWYAGDPAWVAKVPWLADVPRDALGVDLFIGAPERIGAGLGSLALRHFCKRLFDAGTPRLIIDPDAANRRAVRAYEKAGFVPFGRHDAPDGATLLMELRPPGTIR